MGGAALHMVGAETARGTEVGRALDLALAPMALDCLVAVMPEEISEDNYLVMRTMKVVTAIEGGSWATLTRLETDVALCLSSLMRAPERWRADAWDLRMAQALRPYLEAVGLR